MAVDLPDDIVPIGAAAPPTAPAPPPAEKPSLPDDIVPIGKAEEPTPPDLKDPATKAILQRQYGPIWDVFTAPRRAADALSAGFKEGWGEQPLGMNAKDIEWMQKHGLFRNERDEGVAGVFRAFNEAVFFRGAQVLDAAVRSATSLYHGAQVAGQEVGLPRDVVGIPDAFMGSPHPLGVPGEAPKAAEAMRETAAKESPTVADAMLKPGEVVGYHGSTDVITSFDPNQTRLGSGVFFSDNPKLASKFAEGLATDSDPLRIFGEDKPSEIKQWVSDLAGRSEGERIGRLMDEFEGASEDRQQQLYTEINIELRKISGLSPDAGGGSPNVSRVRLSLGKTYEVDMGGRFDWSRESDAIAHAREHGFDSVTFKNSGEEGNF
jgi:hypothetical protein